MSLRVLIVDDNAFIRHSLRLCIEREPGWRVCAEAENGEIAVAAAKKLLPDVVILDWQMPVMDGLEAARQIGIVCPKTAMVMLTLHDSDKIAEEAHSVGIRQVLSKTDAVPRRLLSWIKELPCAQTDEAHQG